MNSRSRRAVPPRPRRPRRGNGQRTRILVFAVVVATVIASVVAYLARVQADREQRDRAAPTVATADLATIMARPRIIFRNNARSDYGVVAMVALADPRGPRGLTERKCDRAAAAADRVLCVSLDRTAVTYKSELLDVNLEVLDELPLGGISSRARLSADGTLAATTAFTSVGDTYASASFSTRTFISAVTDTRTESMFLEDFTLIHDGSKIAPVDRNYWGVTFAADDRTFYATVKFSGQTWLVHGDLDTRTMTTMRSDAECPSLSPDGLRLVYKKRNGMPAGQWRLTSLDLASGREVALAETRSIDDQVAWLDNATVLYGVPGSGGDPDIYDVWQVPADGTGEPAVLIMQASSPTVVG
jgi:hypothetical protein